MFVNEGGILSGAAVLRCVDLYRGRLNATPFYLALKLVCVCESVVSVQI